MTFVLTAYKWARRWTAEETGQEVSHHYTYTKPYSTSAILYFRVWGVLPGAEHTFEQWHWLFSEFFNNLSQWVNTCLYSPSSLLCLAGHLCDWTPRQAQGSGTMLMGPTQGARKQEPHWFGKAKLRLFLVKTFSLFLSSYTLLFYLCYQYGHRR